MRVFEHMNTSNGDKCPVCLTNEDKPVVLVAIEGTFKDGLHQAIQIHMDCLELTYSKDNLNDTRGFIYQYTKG